MPIVPTNLNFPILDSNYNQTGFRADLDDIFVRKDIFSQNLYFFTGQGFTNQQGTGSSSDLSVPTQLGTLTNFAQFSGGRSWSLGVTTNGVLFETGNPMGYTSWTQTLTNVAKSRPGITHIMSIKNDGTLWGRMENNFGQLGDNSVTNRSTAVQVGLTNDWKEVFCGERYTIAIKTGGTLWAWGRNINGQLGLNNVSNYSSPVQVGTLTNWSKLSLSAGINNHCAAIKTDGTLWVWGLNTNGQLGINNTTSRSSPVQVGSETYWKQVTTGLAFTLAIKNDNTLWSWGNGPYGELGLNNQASYSSPMQVGVSTDWKSVTCGERHVIAQKTNGALFSWGSGQEGQTGLGLAFAAGSFYSSPVQIGSFTDWKFVGVSGYSSYFLKGLD